MREIVHNANAFVKEPDPNLQAITLTDQPNPPVIPPQIKTESNLQNILRGDDEKSAVEQLKKVRDEIKEEIVLLPPEKTGIVPIDEKNNDEYLKTLEVFRPDLFVDEPDDYKYIEPADTVNVLVPVGAGNSLPSNDIGDIIAQPEAQTIILAPTNEILAILPPESMEDDDEIDFKVWQDDDLVVSLPIEVDTDKFVLTKDGDVTMTYPNNLQVEDKLILPLLDGTLQLLSIESMEVVATRNLIKRKNDENIKFGNIKMIKNETKTNIRDVVPSESEAILFHIEIKHPNQRRLEKDAKIAKKQARFVKSKTTDLTSLDDSDEKPRIKDEWNSFPTVDIATVSSFPWIDFNHVLDSTDVTKREEAILDILQNSLPPSENDRYYNFHDTNTNVSSIEEDPFTEDIDKLVTQILLINAKLKVEGLSSKERTKLIKTRKLMLKELRRSHGAEELVSPLSKFSLNKIKCR